MKPLLCLCAAAALLTSCGSSNSNRAPMRVERWDPTSQSWVAATPGSTPAPSPAPEALPQSVAAPDHQVVSTPAPEPKRGWMGKMKDAATAPLRWVGVGGAN
ncbi:MAG: hypothetical protein KDK97_15735 [Verrucomicrobiales bacterium]|nr:hypothetical protein [Verrucomicrobiales bacterium]MCP5559816.1 hypothetical protein [Verrucomicrobiaceae bacterium]